MSKVFLDTEFLDDGTTLEPVSLALVTETTAEYYAVFADCDLSRIMAHPWLRANVAPHLPLAGGPGGWHWDAGHRDYASVKPRARIAAEIQAFLAKLADPEIWAWYSPFDAVILCQLYGPMSDLPAGFPAFTRDLMQEADRVSAVLPKQDPPVHHALADARHDLRIAAAIGLIEKTTS